MFQELCHFLFLLLLQKGKIQATLNQDPMEGSQHFFLEVNSFLSQLLQYASS